MNSQPRFIQRRVFISGQVQGVGFRASTLHAASDFPHLQGFVRNLNDGRVEALFAGLSADVLTMTQWCHHGPTSAQITSCEIQEEPYNSSLKKFSLSLK